MLKVKNKHLLKNYVLPQAICLKTTETLEQKIQRTCHNFLLGLIRLVFKAMTNLLF